MKNKPPWWASAASAGLVLAVALAAASAVGVHTGESEARGAGNSALGIPFTLLPILLLSGWVLLGLLYAVLRGIKATWGGRSALLAGLALPFVLGGGFLQGEQSISQGVRSQAEATRSGLFGHTATQLPDGDVVVIGGRDSFGPIATVWRFRTRSNSWVPVSPLPEPRDKHTTTLLSNGKVLVAGGATTGGPPALLYDSLDDKWSPAGAMSSRRMSHIAVPLVDGRVLVAGGSDGERSLRSAEIYDPASNIWSPAAQMAEFREAGSFWAGPLPDGRVLAIGAANRSTGLVISEELYDGATDKWSPAPGPKDFADLRGVVGLPDGSVLAFGGRIHGDATPTALFEPQTGTWRPTANLRVARYDFTALGLPGGTVLVSGGYPSAEGSLSAQEGSSRPPGPRGPLSSAEVFSSADAAWTEAAGMGQGRSKHSLTVLPNGEILAVGGLRSLDRFPQSEIYSPASETWRPVSPPG